MPTRRFDKGIDLYDAQKARFAKIGMRVREMHADLADATYEDAIELTGGGISEATLRRLGHPFARSTPKARINGAGPMRGASKASLNKYMPGFRTVPLLPINFQTGDLQGGFKMVRTSAAGALQAFGLKNDTPYSKYILSDAGTRRMIGRGFTAEMQRRWRARNKALLDTLKGI